MALGGALGRRGTFAWQVWHNLTSTFLLRGRGGTISHPPSFCVAGVALMALGGALGLVLVARDAAALCMAGVALGDIDVRFTWQAWRNLTSTFVLRGRRGTYGTGWRAWAGFSRPGLRGTFAWLAWRLVTSTCVSRGRRGTISHPPSFCMAGVALMALGGALGLALVARDAAGTFACQVWHNLTSTFILRGRRGAISHPPSFCVAGVALMALGGALGLVLVARDAAALCVAGVALGDIDVRFTWQAWHDNLTSTFVLRGRRGAYGTGWRAWDGFSRPGRRGTFAWQAWRNLTYTFVLRGRRGTHGTGWRAWAGFSRP